jgi:hypothetical protein
VLVEHRVGLLHLAVLIANPDQEIPAIELAAGVAAFSASAGHRPPSQPVLDHLAMREYRHRVTQLRAEISELEASDDPRRAARARTEHDWLVAELTGANALAGRVRRFPDDAERARIAVGKAIRRAITQIHQADPVIGEHLHSTIHTGTHCSYRPVTGSAAPADAPALAAPRRWNAAALLSARQLPATSAIPIAVGPKLPPYKGD